MARRQIADEALTCFALWARSNPAHVVTDPAVARRVFDAYRKMRPLVDEQVQA